MVFILSWNAKKNRNNKHSIARASYSLNKLIQRYWFYGSYIKNTKLRRISSSVSLGIWLILITSPLCPAKAEALDIKNYRSECEYLVPSKISESGIQVGWTLRELSQFALCNNPQQVGFRENSKSAEYQIDIARASYWPTIGLTVSKNQAVTTGNSIAFNTSGGSTLVEVVSSIRNITRTNMLQATQTLWDFGARATGVKKAQIQKIISDANARNLSQLLVLQIFQTYIAILSTDDDSIDGDSRPENRLIKSQLANLLGLEPQVDLKLIEPDNFNFECPEDWTVWWNLAFERSDIIISEARIAEDQENIKAEEASKFGSVTATMNIANGYSTIIGKNDTKMIGINYTIPIFNGGASTAALKNSVAQLSVHEAERDSVKNNAKLDVYRSWVGYKAAYEALEKNSDKSSNKKYISNRPLLINLLQARVTLLQSIGKLAPAAL